MEIPWSFQVHGQCTTDVYRVTLAVAGAQPVCTLATEPANASCISYLNLTSLSRVQPDRGRLPAQG